MLSECQTISGNTHIENLLPGWNSLQAVRMSVNSLNRGKSHRFLVWCSREADGLHQSPRSGSGHSSGLVALQSLAQGGLWSHRG